MHTELHSSLSHATSLNYFDRITQDGESFNGHSIRGRIKEAARLRVKAGAS